MAMICSLATHDIHNTPGFNSVFALYPEISTYQTTPVRGINFAYPGNDYAYSRIVRHVAMQRQGQTGIGQDGLRRGLRLGQNAPNPFSGSTTIRFGTAASAPMNLTVYDLAGRVLRTLLRDSLVGETHEAAWDGRDQNGRPVASGVYLYRLSASDAVLVRKMLLAR